MKHDTLTALELNGQPKIPITGLSGVVRVSNSVLINGVGGRKKISCNLAVAYDITTVAGEVKVYSDSSAGALNKYAVSGSVDNLVTHLLVPIGPDLSPDELRQKGTYNDLTPRFPKSLVANVLRAVWAWTQPPSSTVDAVGVVTADSAFRVSQAGDPVPVREMPPPPGTGTTFTEYGLSYSINESYAAFKGLGDLFNGAYTYRFSDGATHTVAESFAGAPDNLGEVDGCFLYGDSQVVVGATFGSNAGINLGDAEGRTPLVNILKINTEYMPGKFYRSGSVNHVSGDQAVIAGSGDSFLSTIFLVNLVDHSVVQIAQQGEPIPGVGGGTFGFLEGPAVSDDKVVFSGRDAGFNPAGLFCHTLNTGELEPIVRVGDIFDGLEVSATSFYPGALDGKVVGFVAYFTDGSSGVYLTTPDVSFSVPFLNISTRSSVQTGDNVLILGYIITGTPAAKQNAPLATGAKKVIIRAIGPSLGGAGVQGPLADPVLELYDSTGALITSNDNWRDTQEQEIIDSTIPPSDDLESAIVATLDPGAYTAIVRGKNGGTGVGLVEIYDLDGAAVSEQANISTRSLVQTGEEVMIGGIIVGGTSDTASTMVLRAIGPSLANAGVANPLQDPTLELHDATGAIIAGNDDWKDTQEAEIEAAQLAPADDRESALQIALGPGAYTAIVRGAGDTTGVALVEAYNLEASGTAAAKVGNVKLLKR